MLKLKLQYFGHLMQRPDSLETTLMLGKISRQEEKGMTEDEMVGWQHRLNGNEFEQTPRDNEGLGSHTKDWEARHTAIHGVAKSQI